MQIFFFKFYFIVSVIFAFSAYSYTPSLNILAPMRMLDPKLIDQFEKSNACNVKIEFVGDHTGYESHLKSELRAFDIVIADERTLSQLTTANLLRTLPHNLMQSKETNSILQVKTPFNSEVNTYVPLFVNPLGIAYNQSVSKIPIDPTWNMLIDPETNPHWRQRIYVPRENSKQIFLALIATHESLTHAKKIPPKMIQWLSKIRESRALIHEPLELAFLGQFVNAGVLFYSDYLRYKNVVSDLSFIIPREGTYFDRYGIAWCLSSTQEALSQKFIAFMIENSGKFTKLNGFFDINYGTKIAMENINSKKKVQSFNEKNFNLTAWILYDESAILPFLPVHGLDR